MAYGATGGMSGGGGMSAPDMTDGPLETKPPPEDKGGDYEGATGILPKSLMAGKDFKVGEEIVLEITRIGENDFEVKYATDKGGDEGHKEGYEEKPDMTGKSDRYRTEMGTMME